MAKSSAVPKGYNTVTTYLVVKGADKVVSFTQKAFGAKVEECHKMDNGKIMHAEVRIGDTLVMISEEMKGCGGPINAMLYMYVPDADASYKKAIKAGAKSMHKPADQFYGHRAGAVKDKGGNIWWLATPQKKLTSSQLKKAAAKAKKK